MPNRFNSDDFDDADGVDVQVDLERERYVQRMFWGDMTEWMVAQSLNADTSKARLRRYVLSEFVLDENPLEHQPEELQRPYRTALVFHQFLDAAGLEEVGEYYPTSGSWHWKKIHRTKSRKTVAELDARLTHIETTLLKAFNMQGAEVRAKKKEKPPVQFEPSEYDLTVYRLQEAVSGAEKAKWEARKALLEFADRLASLLMKASAGFALTIGTLRIVGVPVPPITIQIQSHRISRQEATNAKGILVKQPREEYDPLDDD